MLKDTQHPPSRRRRPSDTRLRYAAGVDRLRPHDPRKEKGNALKKVTVYTDGACRGNPGVGGWGAILVYGSVEKQLSGGERQTTNNRMELMAAISALEALREPCEVDLYTDSKYLSDAVTLGWLEGWRTRGWRRGRNEQVLNPDLWERLYGLLTRHKVTFHWVKGHADNAYNCRCDGLATAYADSLRASGSEAPPDHSSK